MMREWRPSEENELIQAKAQLEPDFFSSNGNAVRQARLWELVSSRVSSSSSFTGEDCKNHWKQLVSRYKAWKKFPAGAEQDSEFFEGIDAIYRSRISEASRGWGFSDEDFSSNESNEEEDEESEEEDDDRDVQAVLEDLFQKMPCAVSVPAAAVAAPLPWAWQENLSTGTGDLLLVNGGACKQEDDPVSEERGAPRWGFVETRELIAIRAEMEQQPPLLPHKNLWDPISARMRERGFSRSADQCKRKWKKLANRYKGKITDGPDSGRKFPVFQELDKVFKARLEASSRGVAEEEQSEESTEEPGRKKRKVRVESSSSSNSGVKQVLSEFIAKQESIDKEWLGFLERKQEEWARREQEWQAEMERLQQQRMKRESLWREHQAQRRAAEENRAQMWDKLLKVLVDSLATEDASLAS